MTQPFHITRLEIDSFKRIVATAICPQTGKPILLTGDNGQGKSSILDSILWAFTNSGVGKPIMDGQPSALVGVEITNGADTYIIRRRAKGANRYLDVTDKDGAAVPKPQGFLDSLVGNLAFDPEAFARLKDKQQADQLREATGLDTDAIDEEIKRLYTLRTSANKDATTAEANYKAAPVVAGEPREMLSAGGLAADRDKLRAEIQTYKAANQLAEETARDVDELSNEITALEAKLAAKKAEHASETAELEKARQQLAAIAATVTDHPAQIDAITEKLETIDQQNVDIQRANDAIKLRADRHATWKAAHIKASQLDKDLEKARNDRAKLIAEAKMPVAGLEILDDVVTLDGIPLSDLNTAKRIEVATRIAIAQNPHLGVIFIREGALINDANLAIIAQVAQDANMQLWIEKFQQEPATSGLHIIDGMVGLENGAPAKPAQMELV